MTAGELAPQRIAFIGGYGHHYLRGALDDKTIPVEAVAVAGDRRDPEATRRRLASVLQQGARWFEDPTAMFEQFSPTVVNIGTLYAHQSEFALEVLARDIPVVSDKPIASSWRALFDLRAALNQPGRILLCEFPFRCEPAFRAAREAVRAGRIGKIALVTAQKSYRFGPSRPDFYRRREDYGSTLLWVASHGVDAIYFTSGLGFQTVCGAHDNVTRPDYGDMEDHCAVIYTLDGGATGVVHGDLLRPNAAATHGDDRLRLIGGQGVIEIVDGRCYLTTHDEPRHDITDTVQPQPIHRELLWAIQRGGSEYYNADDALTVAAALLAGRDAADQRRVVPIREASQ